MAAWVIKVQFQILMEDYSFIFKSNGDLSVILLRQCQQVLQDASQYVLQSYIILAKYHHSFLRRFFDRRSGVPSLNLTHNLLVLIVLTLSFQSPYSTVTRSFIKSHLHSFAFNHFLTTRFYFLLQPLD